MVRAVIGLTLDSAKTYGVVAVVVLVVGAFVAAWALKSLVQKIVVFALLGVLAFAVWTQRESLQDCADKVQANLQLTDGALPSTDAQCSFFGFTITIAAPTPS
jgi:uncharacterized membrane protein YqjE